MKRILFLMLFLIIFVGQAQEKPALEEVAKTELYKLDKPESYSLNNEHFTFTPEMNLIKIKKLQDKEEVAYGQLRRTTDDGLYIMTSNESEEVSFGRFDSLGNFKTLRYDRKTDTVLEDYYQKNPVQARLSVKK